jgi:hypothetical protein
LINSLTPQMHRGTWLGSRQSIGENVGAQQALEPAPLSRPN